ncbi:MAG: hypothetical protein QHJ73_04110, partial [Armatimonadota bacterium]|nr:hypothetical protein [Armatimonadota bacterium]
MRAVSLLVGGLLCASLCARATAHVETIHLVPFTHLDIGFTDTPEAVAQRCKENIDEAIALCEEFPEFRWTIETAWQLEQWLLRTEEPAPRQTLARLVREGRMEVGGAYATMHSGVLSAEGVCRLFLPALRLCRELQVPPPRAALQNDVPGYTWAYPQALAASGIRYFATGINRFVGGGADLPAHANPFWWEGPDGSRVLTWISRESYVEANKWGLGNWSPPAQQRADLTHRLADLEATGY